MNSTDFPKPLNQTDVTIPMLMPNNVSLAFEDRLVKRVSDIVDPLIQKVGELFSLISTLTTTITTSLPTAQATSQALAISRREILKAADDIAKEHKRSKNVVIRGRFNSRKDPTSVAREILKNLASDDLLNKLQYAQWLRKTGFHGQQTVFSGIIVTFSSANAANEMLTFSTAAPNIPNVRSITKDYSYEERETHKKARKEKSFNRHQLKSLRVMLTPLHTKPIHSPIRRHLSSPDLRTLEVTTVCGPINPQTLAERSSSSESLATVINCQPNHQIPPRKRGSLGNFTTSTPAARNPTKGQRRARATKRPRFTPVWSTPIEVTLKTNTVTTGKKPSRSHFRFRSGNRIRPKDNLITSRRPIATSPTARPPAKVSQKPRHQMINPLFPAWSKTPAPVQPSLSFHPLLSPWNFLHTPPPIMNMWAQHRVPGLTEPTSNGQKCLLQPNGPYPLYTRIV